MNFLNARPDMRGARPGTNPLIPQMADHSALAALEQMRFPYELPALPFACSALSPVISEHALWLHHGSHHRGYIEALNSAIEDTEFQTVPLRAVICATARKPALETLFNNAGQSWNHAFYWDCLTPEGGRPPPPMLKYMIEASFGDVAACKRALAQAAVSQFGSGWAWLVQNGKKISVMKTTGADNPLTHGLIPLLALDVWEHAYYVDYRNRRHDYVTAIIDKHLNWDFAASHLA